MDYAGVLSNTPQLLTMGCTNNLFMVKFKYNRVIPLYPGSGSFASGG